MDSKSLIGFRTVFECRSISKAAGKLYITPQGLSKNIKSLEMELDVSLFQRTANGVIPTAYGQYLYDKSETLIRNMLQLQKGLEQLKQQEQGFLRLCSAYGILRILKPDFIQLYSGKEHQQLDYMEFPDLYVEKEISEGNADVGMTVGPVDSDKFVVKPIFRKQIYLLVHDEHPLALKEEIYMEDLKNQPIIIESKAFKIYHLFQERCRNAGFEPNILFQTSGFSLCHKLCKEKRGVSLAVDEIRQDMDSEHLRTIPFADPFWWQAVIFCKHEMADTAAVLQFINFTESYVRGLQI